jgi:hypothetical protein
VFFIRRYRLRDTLNDMVDCGFLAHMPFVRAVRRLWHCDPPERLHYRYLKVPGLSEEPASGASLSIKVFETPTPGSRNPFPARILRSIHYRTSALIARIPSRFKQIADAEAHEAVFLAVVDSSRGSASAAITFERTHCVSLEIH